MEKIIYKIFKLYLFCFFLRVDINVYVCVRWPFNSTMYPSQAPKLNRLNIIKIDFMIEENIVSSSKKFIYCIVMDLVIYTPGSDNDHIIPKEKKKKITFQNFISGISISHP